MRSKSSKSSEASLLDQTKQLGIDLLTSRSHVNNAPILLSTLANGKSPDASRAEALRSLQAFFVSLLRSGTLELGARNPEAVKDAGSPEGVYKMWVCSKYQEFRKVVYRIAKEDSFSELQLESLNSWMDLVRAEKPGEFNNTLYYKLCEALVRCKGPTNGLLQMLAKNYFKYADVRYYTYSNIEKLVAKRLKRNEEVEEAGSSDDDDENRKGVSLHTFARNTYEVLSSLPPPSSDAQKDGDAVYELWVQASDEGEKGTTSVREGEERKKDKASRIKLRKPNNPKKQKAAFSKAWMTFLRLSLPLDTYKKVLGRLHRHVLPYINNPILLSDFLTQSYNVGGLISVMALSSLFILITGHGLEYPDFYNKLYALLEPSVFVAKHRARFFELLDACLKSSHLPAYLAAAFAKRLGRLVLSAPPSGSIVVIALIHNILRRHPSVNHLVHRDFSQASTSPDMKDGGSGEETTDVTAAKGVPEQTSNRPVEEKHGADPFRADEPDTAKTDALKSSLWEVETLRRHYCPAVSRFVVSLETDLTVRAKTTELAISDFSSTSYATIFSEEVGRRLKTVPLAYYHTVPSTLFAENCFEGWSFGDVDVGHTKAVEEPKTDGTEEVEELTNAEEGAVEVGVDKEEQEEGEGTEEEDEEEECKNSMEEDESERDSDGSNGSRSRSEQSEGEDWPRPLLKRFRDR